MDGLFTDAQLDICEAPGCTQYRMPGSELCVDCQPLCRVCGVEYWAHTTLPMGHEYEPEVVP